MNKRTNKKFAKAGVLCLALSALAALSLPACSVAAYAQGSVAMAPPVHASYATSASSDSVFNWRDVPQNQQVPIRRAVFDRDGYQLYDTVGETIVVPFTNHNLSVMKFGVSDNGIIYFVNTGNCPVLYVPRHAYLENAADPGARWYPYSESFHPATPVFIGIAPSWSVFITMGWYPGMCYYGGYWCNGPFYAGAVFPEIGLFFLIGGQHYWGWGGYAHYCDFHPAPYRITVVNENIYRFAARPYYGHRQFVGISRFGRAHNGFMAGRPAFRGTRNLIAANRSFPGGGFNRTGRFNSGAHRFQGGRTMAARQHAFRGGRPFAAHHAMPGGRAFQGGRSFGNSHAYGGSHSFGGGGPRPSVGGHGRDHRNQ